MEYGRFPVLSRVELERFFHLDDEDRKLIADRRRDSNRLGFALQVVTVRYLGMFLPDPVDVPVELVEYLAEQLGIDDPSCVKAYTDRKQTRYDHQDEIVAVYGLVPFGEVEGELLAWVTDQAWMTCDGPKVLTAGAARWLREPNALLPGITTLERLVTEGKQPPMRGCGRTWRASCAAARRQRCCGCWTLQSRTRASAPVMPFDDGVNTPLPRRRTGPSRSPTSRRAGPPARRCHGCGSTARRSGRRLSRPSGSLMKRGRPNCLARPASGGPATPIARPPGLSTVMDFSRFFPPSESSTKSYPGQHLREVFLGVVDDDIGAERVQAVGVATVRGRGDVRAEVLGESDDGGSQPPAPA